LVGAFSFKNNKSRLAALILLPLLIISFSKTTIKDSSDLIFEDESAYQYISVTQDQEGIKYLLFNEGGGIQSIYNSNRVLTDEYYDYFNVLPYLVDSDKTKRVLIIGLAGGTIANQLHYFFGEDIEIEGVEIDKKVIDVAQKHFSLDESIVKIYNQDGRIFLRNTSKEYDIIVVDAYHNELYIPWTLTTREFWSLIKGRLTEEGIVAININSVSRESDLLNSISNTMASVFDNTYIMQIQMGGWNYMITASQNQLDFQSIANLISDKELQDLAAVFIDRVEIVKYDNQHMVLTDNRAPIEFMTEAMGLDYLKTLHIDP
jgi:spermidine synthase